MNATYEKSPEVFLEVTVFWFHTFAKGIQSTCVVILETSVINQADKAINVLFCRLVCTLSNLLKSIALILVS
jgi:hypothetical protein